MGCADPVYSPRLSAISPSEGANDVDVRVTISGQDLEPRIHTDFGASDQSRWNRAFSAWLVPVDKSLPQVALDEVQFEPARTLGGIVRAGAARGFYGLRVVDPHGHEGFVPEVYRVVASPSTVAKLRFEPIGPQRPGVPFTVQLTAVDSTDRVVDGFTAGVDLKDGTGTLNPRRIEPFVLGRARAQVVVLDFASANTLTATDALGRQGASNPFAVLPGLVVELSFVTAAQPVGVGQCSTKVELEARDTFGFPAKLSAAVDAEVFAAPPQGVAFFSDPGCTQPLARLSLPAGESRLSLYFRAGPSPGVFQLRVVPLLLPSSSQAQTVTQ